MHSKYVGSTQVFDSKRKRKKAKGTEKGTQHLMKKVGSRKPESTWQWYPVVPMEL